MSSYAVLWQNGDGDPMSGRLEFDPRGLSLHGGNRESQGRVEIPFDEIVGVERHPCIRIGPCRAIRFTTRAAGSLLLGTVAGVGVLSEILSLVQDALAALP